MFNAYFNSISAIWWRRMLNVWKDNEYLFIECDPRTL